MKKLFAVILVILCSIFFGLYIKQDSGHIFILFKSWVVELSLWTAIILIISSFLLISYSLKFIRNLLNLPSLTRTWLDKRRQEASYAKTSKGLLKMAEGDFKQAIKLLISSANKQKQPIINYLVAAFAAQELKNINQRDEFLRKSFECSPNNGLSISLMRANLQISNHEYEAALASLSHLLHEYGYNKIVFKQLLIVYLKLKDWKKLIELLPDLYRYTIYSKKELLDYEVLAAVNYLKNINNSSNIDINTSPEQLKIKADNFYNHDISLQARSNYKVVIAYIESLFTIIDKPNVNLVTSSVDLVMKTLIGTKDNLSAQRQLLNLYGNIALTEDGLIKLEKYLNEDNYNIDILFTLGKVSIAIQNYDKAYQYLNQGKQLRARTKTDLPIDYYLAYVLIELGELESGLALFQQSFKSCPQV